MLPSRQGTQDIHRPLPISHVFPPIQDFDFWYSTSATIKAAVQTAAGTTYLIEERGSGRTLFVQLLFTLEQARHHGEKVLPRSMYVPSRATISDL
jgi:hypothetical protein